MRSRFVPLIAVVLLAGFTVVPAAFASKTEAGAANPFLGYTGSDWVGKVTLGYATPARDANGPQPGQIIDLRFANECSKRGSEITAAINVGRTGQFSYRGRGFTVVGNVVGPQDNPREIAGTAAVRQGGCASGPWWFGVFPGD